MSEFTLSKHETYPGVPGSLLLIIMDGVGLYKGQAEGYEGNAFDQAKTPNLDRLFKDASVFRKLQAHGKAVGLPSDGDMGNSEVGHNAMGAGRVFAQGAKLVNEAISSGRLFEGTAWKELVQQVKAQDSAFHLIGLLSDGNVHSHIEQLFGLLDRLSQEQVSRIRLHPLADGRDVDPVTYHVYLKQLQGKLDELNAKGADARIASGGGRMYITMDRYNADWQMVKRGWDLHVLGKGRGFASAQEALTVLRQENEGVLDQDLPGFVVLDEQGVPVGPVLDGDSVVFFNFRGDRAIEISRAFTETDFDKFDRERLPDICYAGMMEYDGDLHIPPRFLVDPPAISRTVSEYLAKNGISQYAISETQKYGHVTYFWNGNNSEKFSKELETWVEIPSDNISFDKKPQMKAREITEEVIKALDSKSYKFLRLNFANGDMVGHTGSLPAAVQAMEVVDECIGKLEQAAKRVGATIVITADHGNSDQMIEINKKTGEFKLDENGKPITKTSHTLSPVPWLLLGQDATRFTSNDEVDNPGLGNLAATLLLLLGYQKPEDYLPALVKVK